MNARLTKDLGAGVIFTAFGAGSLWIGRTYPSGSAMSMGPGYFPWLIGAGLCLVGIAALVRGLYHSHEHVEFGELRPVVLVLAATIAFAVTFESLGLAIATALLTGLAGFADGRFSILRSALLFVILLFIAQAVFVYGIGMPLSLRPR